MQFLQCFLMSAICQHDVNDGENDPNGEEKVIADYDPATAGENNLS